MKKNELVKTIEKEFDNLNQLFITFNNEKLFVEHYQS